MFITTINTVLSVDDNTVLSVSLSHQQDALPRQGLSLTLFNFDDALTKREQIPNEMGLGCGKRERVNVKKP